MKFSLASLSELDLRRILGAHGPELGYVVVVTTQEASRTAADHIPGMTV